MFQYSLYFSWQHFRYFSSSSSMMAVILLAATAAPVISVGYGGYVGGLADFRRAPPPTRYWRVTSCMVMKAWTLIPSIGCTRSGQSSIHNQRQCSERWSRSQGRGLSYGSPAYTSAKVGMVGSGVLGADVNTQYLAEFYY